MHASVIAVRWICTHYLDELSLFSKQHLSSGLHESDESIPHQIDENCKALSETAVGALGVGTDAGRGAIGVVDSRKIKH